MHATTVAKTFTSKTQTSSPLHPCNKPLHERREGEYAGADGDAYLGVVGAEADDEA